MTAMDALVFLCDLGRFPALSASGHERLGEASRFEIALLAPEPLDTGALLGKPGAIVLSGSFGERRVHGVIARVSATAASDAAAARLYRVELCSVFHLLSLRRRSRVFQHITVPALVERLVREGGYAAGAISVQLLGEHREREYVVQYEETDAAFVRRLCEEEGLYFRFEPRDGFDAFVLEDASPHAPSAEPAALLVADTARLATDTPAAFSCRAVRQRRPGKVTLRDYDPQKPALLLEGVADAGKEAEQAEVYRAPGRFSTPSEGKTRAQVLLESLRADAKMMRFETSAVGLAPGLAVELEPAPDYAGSGRLAGKVLVVAVEHVWSHEVSQRSMKVTAIPLDVPYRLPVITPRPKVHGVQSAVVTGAPGEEIHTDASGRVRLRFHWDREQASDDKSSLPVRVMQPNLPGSMLIPRVGWEVLVAFEQGDPDRPVVIGRAWNGKHPPPFGLPANKTMTALATPSSPGGKRQNAVHMDDAAGRQHMVFAAGFSKTTTVANDMLTQTVGFEALSVTGSQSWSIGGSEAVSIGNAMMVEVGSQSGSVGGSQSLLIKANGSTSTGSETVAVGGALLEQVGNPATGAAAFAEAAALAGVGEIPGVGAALSKGIGWGKALSEAYEHGGMKGAVEALKQQATHELAGHVPGADAIVAAADSAGLTPWSEKAQRRHAEQEGGGGTGGSAGMATTAAQVAPGHRKTIVDGAMVEAIGAAYTVTTPGSIKWTTMGASIFAVGGCHAVRALKINRTTAGVSSDTAARVGITTALAIGRTVTGAMKSTIGGSLQSRAGGKHDIKAGGPLTINVGGSLTLEGGSVVFKVGSSSVAVHGGGVLFRAPSITINGKAVQSGKATFAQ
jgi:type VI secretion system secreted protein VgrG